MFQDILLGEISLGLNLLQLQMRKLATLTRVNVCFSLLIDKTSVPAFFCEPRVM